MEENKVNEARNRYVTVSFSLPKNVSADVNRLAAELNVSKSALMTAIISSVMKWCRPEDIFPGGNG